MVPTTARLRRRALLAAAVLSALPALAGCGVGSAGVTGVTVTAEGAPVGVVLVCHDRIDTAVLYPDEPVTDPDADVTAEAAEPEYTDSWSAATPVEDFSTWPLTLPPGAETATLFWTPEEPPRPLEPGRLYTLYGATRDNSWSTDHHSFTLADLKHLTPDRVSYTHGDTVRTTTLTDFRAHACDAF
ncbi:hypothetical protein [Streptomyces sp. NPDC002057]|uniref:hypothetical protein n=1 Tax=Streptomyces sp. NPDC002057 TaxID=3154664 RepID=UPI0033194516